MIKILLMRRERTKIVAVVQFIINLTKVYKYVIAKYMSI